MRQKDKKKTYLTSRSEVQNLDLFENNLCEISLDWITVNGIFHAEQFINKLHDNNWALQDELDGHPTKFGLKRINSNTYIQSIITSIPKLEEDTMKISEERYRIFDMHLRNISWMLLITLA